MPLHFLKKKKKKKSSSEYLSLLGQAQINENQSLKKADKTLTSGLMSSNQLKEATKKKRPLEFEREERIRQNHRKMGVRSPADKGEAKEGNGKKWILWCLLRFSETKY
jgi:hypothetical protein